MDEFDARVFFNIVLGDFGGVVGGTVVYEDDFEILVSLVNDGVETSREVFGGVVNGNYDGNFIFHF